jgi:oxygen-independent coproporphyrinogen-3 oxidase
MTPDLLHKYSRPVPRYTSYPTAPHFHAGVDEETYRTWLGAIPPDEPLSLYFHVPFCRQLCWYCGCHTSVTRNEAALVRYAAALEREIALVAGALCHGHRVAAIHWGGGTPNILPPELWEDVMDSARRHFDLDDGTEIAAELDPRLLDEEWFAALRRQGVTRASLGVQDFDPGVQAHINRIQPFDLVARAVDGLRGAGVAGINFDLIYGLPGQDEDTISNTARLAASLAPDRLALFGYAHVPWMKGHQEKIPADLLPGPWQRFAMSRRAAGELAAAGYSAIGFDHFARPDDPLCAAAGRGDLRRNFQGYTTDSNEVLVGFGASAIGTLPSGYVQNEARTAHWLRAVEAGRLPVVRGVACSAEDAARRRLIETLLCAFEVEVDDPALIADGDTLQAMLDDGLAEWDGCVLRVTETGRPMVRTLGSVFDAHLARGAGRHSAPV